MGGPSRCLMSELLDIRIDDLGKMSAQDAIMIAFLRKYWQLCPEKTEDGYVPLAYEKVQKYLHIPEQTRRRSIRRLEGYGLVRVKLLGCPPRAFVRVIFNPKKKVIT